jgi:serine protease Do
LIVSQLAPGSKVTLKLLRSESDRKPSEKTVTATLASLPSDRSGSNDDQSDSNQSVSSDTDSLDGVEVADLDANTRQELNVPDNIKGAIVTNVEPESNSAEAGLQRGDIILEIDRKPVKDADQAVKLSEDAKSKRVLLRIWRNGGSTVLTVDNAKKKD